MDDEYDQPVPWDDLLFTVEMALCKAERLWPKKHMPGDHVRLKPVARAVVAHLELCGMRCYRRPPAPGHGSPEFSGAPRRSGGKDPLDGAPGG